jgi:hypothetical protein
MLKRPLLIRRAEDIAALTIDDVVELVRAWADSAYPGKPLRQFRIDFVDGDRIALPFPPRRQSERTKEHEPYWHSEDFRSVRWNGEVYDFSTSQAIVMEKLWEAWEDGTPAVAQETLLEAAESEGNQLRDLFKRHPAWGKVIVQGPTRGTYQLQAEPSKRACTCHASDVI